MKILIILIVSIFVLISCSDGKPQASVDKLSTKEKQENTVQVDTDAQVKLGLQYITGQDVPVDYKKAALLFHEAAEQGNAEAQFNLGYAYTNGRGVPQDYRQALIWFRKAADQGHAGGQFGLGITYYKIQNNQESIFWLRKAANQGHAGAQFSLGAAYQYGGGVRQNNIIAYALYNLAAIDFSDAAISRDELALSLTSQEIQQGQSLSSEMSKSNNLIAVLDSYKTDK